MSSAGWAELAERFARALGVWATEHREAPMLVMRRKSGQLCVVIGSKAGGRSECQRDVDDATMLVILLGHARGERVDFGRCHECGGSKVEEMFFTVDELYDDADMERHEAEGWAFQCDGLNNDDEDGAFYDRPCQACTVDGEPSGRDTRPLARALLDAMGPLQFARNGDPASIIAIASHLHLCSGPEHAAVFGDWREAFPGRRPSELPPPTDGLGMLLSAWLRGPSELAIAHAEALESAVWQAIPSLRERLLERVKDDDERCVDVFDGEVPPGTVFFFVDVNRVPERAVAPVEPRGMHDAVTEARFMIQWLPQAQGPVVAHARLAR